MSTDDRELLANITPFGLRMQPGLKEQVAESARRNNRSMNAEIVARLQNSGLDRSDDGSFRIWLPPELLARVLDEASRRETDPNDIFHEVIEKAFPPPPTLEGELIAMADKLAFENREKTEREKLFITFVDEYVRDAAKGEPTLPWRKK
ncbi:Arc family DNA-binding protein [Oricola sp.]|uniref:Arc family DNA-binding protein n=1 Tax=Oricola sp. TaxID=1979950 RepID=UPI00260041E0|nr:Arc family DNA-binding protein [Oricola sp.]MCI5073962.1 Arc family DNA-binding protein [Oricola sp.]